MTSLQPQGINCKKKKYSTFNSVKKSAVCHLQCIRGGVWFFHSISSLKKIVQLFVIDSWVRVSSYNKKRLCYLQNIVLSSKGIITHQILGVKRLKIEKPKQQSNQNLKVLCITLFRRFLTHCGKFPEENSKRPSEKLNVIQKT